MSIMSTNNNTKPITVTCYSEEDKAELLESYNSNGYKCIQQSLDHDNSYEANALDKTRIYTLIFIPDNDDSGTSEQKMQEIFESTTSSLNQ